MKSKSTTSIFNICQICGAEAKEKYYNVLCCVSCKAFFRRTSMKVIFFFKFSQIIVIIKDNIRCPFVGKCEIEFDTRRKACRACRLKKCYELGMKSKKNNSFPESFENCDPFGQPMPTPLFKKHSEILTTETLALHNIDPHLDSLNLSKLGETKLVIPETTEKIDYSSLYRQYNFDLSHLSTLNYIECLKNYISSYNYYNLLLQHNLL